mgnify:CR=1 FL=1
MITQAYRIGPPLALWFRQSSVLDIMQRRKHRVRNPTFPYSRCNEDRFGLFRVHTLEFDHDFEARHVDDVLAANAHLTHARFHHVLAFEEAYPELIDSEALIVGLGRRFSAIITVRGVSVRRDLLVALGGSRKGRRGVEISFWEDPFPRTSTILLAHK